MTYAETILNGVDIPLPPEPDDGYDGLPPRRLRAAEGTPDDPADLDGAIEYRKQRLRVDREARRRLDAEEHPPTELPAVRPLSALLAEPDAPTAYRIDKVMPAGSRIMLSAQFKAGKSTLAANVIRALVDGEPFLGEFVVRDRARRLVLIDDELGDSQLRRWLRDQGIVRTDAVADVVCLRGRLDAFNLLDAVIRQRWVDRLRSLDCDYLILDCLRPVLDALGLDENHDAGRFLVAFDAVLTAAGVLDALVVDHMGHSGERTRGDSRKLDWPDALWRLVREDDDPGSARYFSAYGRDVDVHEGRLSFDTQTRRLAYSGGDRADSRTESAYVAVVDLLADDALNGEHNADGTPVGMGLSAIETALVGPRLTRKAVRDGIAAGLKSGTVEWQRGPRKAKLHRIAHPCTECGHPVTGDGPRHQSCPPDADGMVLT